jgi:uncharacterized small protein (DUF1192 family)
MWDDDKIAKPRPAAGDDLSTLSVAELESRITVFEAEIVRLRSEADRKRKISQAANDLFKASE